MCCRWTFQRAFRCGYFHFSCRGDASSFLEVAALTKCYHTSLLWALLPSGQQQKTANAILCSTYIHCHFSAACAHSLSFSLSARGALAKRTSRSCAVVYCNRKTNCLWKSCRQQETKQQQQKKMQKRWRYVKYCSNWPIRCFLDVMGTSTEDKRQKGISHFHKNLDLYVMTPGLFFNLHSIFVSNRSIPKKTSLPLLHLVPLFFFSKNVRNTWLRVRSTPPLLSCCRAVHTRPKQQTSCAH